MSVMETVYRLKVSKTIILMGASLLSTATAQRIPSSCSVCSQTKRMAWGSVTNLRQTLLKYELPKVPASLQDGPEAPWVFEMTLDLDGKLCSLKSLGDGDSATTSALSKAIRKWKFSPFELRIGAVCLQSRIFVYVRSKNGHLIIDIPGITSPL